MHHVSVTYYFISSRLFSKQQVDGQTLISLETCASIEQLCSCGLKTVKQQLKLKRLVHDQSTAVLVTTQPVSSILVKVKDVKEEKARKLTREELKCLPPEEKRVYLMM